jgi:hypothetical protein
VLEVQLVENLQRDDLHELEEAEGYDELMKLKGISADAVAVMVGKSRAYVYARLKLLALDMDGRKAFYAGEIDASRALYIARIANPALRAKALKIATTVGYNGDRVSVREFRKRLSDDEFSVHLSTAPFSLEDFTFYEEVKVKKGKKAETEHRVLPACKACPSYTGNAIDLFSQGDDPNVCTDPACFKIKVVQHSRRLREHAIATGAEIITGDAAKKILPGQDQTIGYVDLDTTCDDDRPELPELKRKDFDSDEDFDAAMDAQEFADEDYKQRSFRQILEGEAVHTVLVEDPKTKQLRTMVPVDEAKKALAKKKIQLSDYQYRERQSYTPPPVTEAEKKERERQKERQEQELQFRREIFKRVAEKWSGPLKETELHWIADTLLDNSYYGEDDPLRLVYGDEINESKMKEAELIKLIALLTVAQCVDEYGNPKPLLEMARRFKIDPDKIKKDLKAAAKAKDAPEKPAKKAAAKKAKKQ